MSFISVAEMFLFCVLFQSEGQKGWINGPFDLRAEGKV